jgi:hypothetical protein
VDGLARHDPDFLRLFALQNSRETLKGIDIRGFNRSSQKSGAVITA